MKSLPLVLAVVVAIGIGVFFAFSKESEPAPPQVQKVPAPIKPQNSEPRETPPYAQNDPDYDYDSLFREVDAEVPRRPNAAGHVIIASALTSDLAKTDALLKSFARGQAHLDHMRHENSFVTRRQIVELPASFAEIGERIRQGEPIENITIPDFDGGTFEMKYDPTLMGPSGAGNGTLIGGIPGQEASDVILGYYDQATSGYVNIPTQGRVLEYMSVGGKQIVVKEIDLEARAIAEPCLRCSPNAHGHAQHPAGMAHDLATKNSP